MIVVVMILPAAFSMAENPAVIRESTAPFSSDNLLDQSTATPGYANGNPGYLDGFRSNGTVSPLLGGCGIHPMGLISFVASKNFGNPTLTVAFNATTQCGITPYSVTWAFGDGNRSTQTTSNASWQAGSVTDQAITYTHSYHYIGSFIAKIWIVDQAATNVSGSIPIYVSFTPSLFYSFYNETGLISRGLNRSAYSIGLVEECNKNIANSVYQTDFNTFDTEFGLASTTLNFFISGGTSCTSTDALGPTAETSLDIEWAHVAAPGAKIYVCLDTLDSVAGLEGCDSTFYADRVTDNTTIVSNSFGFCAVSGNYVTSPSCTNAGDPYASTWSSAETAGMNLFASVGDQLPNSICDTANYDASNPYGIAVGGTTITGVSTSGSYGSEKSWATQITGQQCTYTRGGNQVGVNGEEGETYGTNSHYNAPSWQASVLGNTYRYFPDVSMDSNVSTGVPIVSQGTWLIAGGTSVGSPIWAGILDMLFQALAPGLSGFAGSFFYAHPACFHGITNPVGGQDGMGTPNVGCLSNA
jgi:subtilase family serine protease